MSIDFNWWAAYTFLVFCLMWKVEKAKRLSFFFTYTWCKVEQFFPWDLSGFYQPSLSRFVDIVKQCCLWQLWRWIQKFCYGSLNGRLYTRQSNKFFAGFNILYIIYLTQEIVCKNKSLFSMGLLWNLCGFLNVKISPFGGKPLFLKFCKRSDWVQIFNQHLIILVLVVNGDFHFHSFSFCQSKARISQENVQTSRRTATTLLEDSVSSVLTLFRKYVRLHMFREIKDREWKIISCFGIRRRQKDKDRAELSPVSLIWKASVFNI